jgi:hypothetical protein
MPQQIPSRSRLDDAPDAYAIALSVADQLDGAGLDLWAAGVRSCLDAEGSTARQEHLVVELVRLSRMSMVRQQGLESEIAGALARLQVGLGRIDLPVQPLYTAVRELADHLELNGGRRWLGRLRTVMSDADRTADARLRRLAAVLELMQPGTPGLPEGASSRVDAVAVRLPRHRDVEDTARYVTFALRPPQPSRRTPTQGPGQRPVAGRA